jgi:hypothetical protein
VILTSFFKSFGIIEIEDFLSVSEVDLKTSYSTEDDPNTMLYLTPILVKKLLSLQLWFASQPAKDLSTWYSFTAEACSA